MNNENRHPAFERLPKRLTISFPIWGLYDTPGENAAYKDMDKFVLEHKERGFNCIRLDDGAGLIHDLEGNRLGEVEVYPNVFGEYSKVMRQQGDIYGDGGKCDLYKRLIELCTAAKKYGVYVILSSWYFLHTYWFHPQGEVIEKELYDIPPKERFMAFAKLLDYILNDLEEQNLDETIAYAEIFNEADGLPFINGYGGKNGLSDDEIAEFRKKHEEAIEWLKNRHPQILFAFDSYTSWTDKRQMPSNMQVYNFHDYYMWGIYDEVLDEHKEFFKGEVCEEDVRKTREGLRAAADDWYQRVARYSDLDASKLGELEKYLEEKLNEKFDEYLEKVDTNLENVRKQTAQYENLPIVCGEGVSYIGSKQLIWEEKSDKYWELVEKSMLKQKAFGLWGTVIRTCMGPEDPCWNMRKDKIKYLNELFLQD